MSETDPTIAERCARYRARKAGKRAEAARCPLCNSLALQLRQGGLCRRCWLKTDEGRAYQRRRIAEYRARARKLTPATDALQSGDRG